MPPERVTISLDAEEVRLLRESLLAVMGQIGTVTDVPARVHAKLDLAAQLLERQQRARRAASKGTDPVEQGAAPGPLVTEGSPGGRSESAMVANPLMGHFEWPSVPTSVRQPRTSSEDPSNSSGE
jgi:hypothetical protein